MNPVAKLLKPRVRHHFVGQSLMEAEAAIDKAKARRLRRNARRLREVAAGGWGKKA